FTPGCQLFGLVGAMAESAHEQGSTTYPADYTGLEGHSYAVIISADRLIEADHPGITTRLTQIIDRDLHANAGATAHIPPGRLLSFLYANPQWQALPRGELGEQLGVDRLIVIELVEYTLHEPGNRYLWNGVASGIVEVYEVDSALPDDPMYEHSIAVTFPDRSGVLEEELPRTVVTSELSRRFGARAAWLFYSHEERNDLRY
ncbi:MAG: hypothetical protein K8E66_12335, partial [Phycisphaerales bacterium]|nr:hypothetical protein [Phycisphaerales bacterium]